MKVMLKKISDVFKNIFGYGIMITLFVGGMTFVGYIVALIIGGEIAEAICTFIYKQIMPIMIYATNCFVILGIITMYMTGELALIPDKKKC